MLINQLLANQRGIREVVGHEVRSACEFSRPHGRWDIVQRHQHVQSMSRSMLGGDVR